MPRIGIIGGGVAGSTTALSLSQLGLEITLFEKNTSLVNGPPFCHLHAGGNLYREISDHQCITLLKQSIEFLRFYPYAVDYRPTVIAVPTRDPQTAEDLLPRLDIIKKEYINLIKQDPLNEVLGNPKDYYKLYSKEKILDLKSKDIPKKPSSDDEWMIPVAKYIDLDKVQFPLVLVQEYGLNLFSLSSGVQLTLQELNNVSVQLESEITNLEFKENKWKVSYKQNNSIHLKEFDYLINSAGFKIGYIDDLAGFNKERFVEFKAAYVTKWETEDIFWPEIIFHGTRGTPNGMAQFTPYNNGHFQIHGMTEDITLFEDGLAKSTNNSADPKLPAYLKSKISTHWEQNDYDQRTINSINHLSYFIPSFQNAKVASKPLFGAQQIPGKDKDLRAADVSFENQHYARCEIVKVSSVFTMINLIIKNLQQLNLLENKLPICSSYTNLNQLNIDTQAKKIAHLRNYPDSLATTVCKGITSE